MSTTKITVQTTVSADTKKVWAFYTKPEHITKWNFASEDWHCPSAENDMRIGGKYSARMEAKDGSWGFDFEAIYDEVVNEEKFTYTLADGRKVNVNFKNLGDKTAVTVIFDAETENSEAMQRDGWQAILDNFRKYAEAN